MSRRRPNDDQIQDVLRAYRLGHLLTQARGLRTRIAEAGRSLTSDETLRLDLARAELGQVRLLIIDSLRFRASFHRNALVQLFASRCEASILVAEDRQRPLPRMTQPTRKAYQICNAV